MKKKSFFLPTLFLVIFFTTTTVSYAQNTVEDTIIKTEIIVSNSIKELEKRNIQANESKAGVQGYRIQLFSDSGNDAKNKANKVKSDFLAKYPDAASYVEYSEPNFKVRVGDFRSRLEAEKFHAKVALDFPYAFIVKDIIDFEKIAPGF